MELDIFKSTEYVCSKYRSSKKGWIEMMEETHVDTITLGMGCFWSPDARFGSFPGVLRTRTGYAGGTSLQPTYRNMGDHTETIEVDFDASIISLEEILLHFWKNHYPNRDNYKGTQYISLLCYRSDEQLQTIESVKARMEAVLGEEIETKIVPFQEFTPAEERHQKYYLKRYPKALEQLKTIYTEEEELTDSTFAARLNGFVKGFGTKEELKQEIQKWNIEKKQRELLTDKLNAMKW